MQNKHAPVTQAVAEDGMRDLGFHAPAVGIEKAAPARIREQAPGCRAGEIAVAQLAAIERSNGYGIGDQGSKWLHQIEGQCRAPRSRRVKCADGRLKTR